MKSNKKWLILLILPAIAGYIALQNNINSNTKEKSSPPIANMTDSLTPVILTETPTVTATYEGCYFVWANQDLPELTQKVDTAIRKLQPNAGAKANAYGENCVYADGHFTFGAMETDFYVHLPVADLKNEESFGNWIIQVMSVISQLPPSDVPGGQPGFTEFTFTKSETEQLTVRVPLERYRSEAQGKTGTELFRLFYSNP